MPYVKLKTKFLMTCNLGVVVVGDTRVGKTTLITTYGSGTYPQEYVTTIGHSYVTSIEINGEEIEVNVHDTGGSSAHQDIRQQLYNKGDVFLICFDVCERKTFLHVEQFWLNELRRLRGNFPFVIVGCKADLREADSKYHVQYSEALQLARDLDCHYFECSSVTQRNVKETFDKAVKVALQLEPHAMEQKRGCMQRMCGLK